MVDSVCECGCFCMYVCFHFGYKYSKWFYYFGYYPGQDHGDERVSVIDSFSKYSQRPTREIFVLKSS